ncbi:MAG: molybdenum cofactor biosynthesis protein MoaE [Actinomycetota bacterium]|nr:molybdenum cofactor biosynthesis protein MoaE [Actinomycetota bacterium]
MVTSITDAPLDVVAILGEVSSTDCGGIAVFVGSVRETASAKDKADTPVTRLEYEAHPTLAEEKLAAIAAEATSRWDVQNITAVHRTGVCELGEPTVVIACAAPHRADALEACRWIIDELKREVPIWKKEVYADGSSWIGAP